MEVEEPTCSGITGDLLWLTTTKADRWNFAASPAEQTQHKNDYFCHWKSNHRETSLPCELATQSSGHRAFLYMTAGCLFLKAILHIMGVQWTSLSCISMLQAACVWLCRHTLHFPPKEAGAFMSSTRECVRFTARCGYWEGLPTTPCRTEIIPISPSCQHRVLPASVLPVGSALVAPKPTEEEVLKPVHGLLLPGFDIAVIFNVPTWVDSWFFLLLINVIF